MVSRDSLAAHHTHRGEIIMTGLEYGTVIPASPAFVMASAYDPVEQAARDLLAKQPYLKPQQLIGLLAAEFDMQSDAALTAVARAAKVPAVDIPERIKRWRTIAAESAVANGSGTPLTANEPRPLATATNRANGGTPSLADADAADGKDEGPSPELGRSAADDDEPDIEADDPLRAIDGRARRHGGNIQRCALIVPKGDLP
jgi:hypothetical protein